jgi:hypothetical protein
MTTEKATMLMLRVVSEEGHVNLTLLSQVINAVVVNLGGKWCGEYGLRDWWGGLTVKIKTLKKKGEFHQNYL